MQYYYLDPSQNVVGPVAAAEIQRLIDQRVIAPDADVCLEGAERWTPLPSSFRKPPPLPPGAGMPKKPGAGLAVSFSVVALVVSVAALLFGPVTFHKSLKNFDFSNPANVLKSIQTIYATGETTASKELAKMEASESTSDDFYLFYQNPKECEVVRTVEATNSGEPKNNGILISFIKHKRADSVEVFKVMEFKKNAQGLLLPTGRRYVSSESETSEDKRIDGMIKKWKEQGSLD